MRKILLTINRAHIARVMEARRALGLDESVRVERRTS